MLPGRKVNIYIILGIGWDKIKSFLKMSEWIKTAAFVAFPFIGAVPGSLITRKSMDWYDVSDILDMKKILIHEWNKIGYNFKIPDLEQTILETTKEGIWASMDHFIC